MNRVIFVCLALISPGVNVVEAESIYRQTGSLEPLGAFSSNDTSTGQKIADNFLFNGPESATVRSLRLIGGYGVTNPPPTTPPLDALPFDAFRVVFLADSSGAPGAPLSGGDFHVGAAVRRAPTGGPLLNGVSTPLHYSVDLGAGITLNPDTVYWLSIANNVGTGYGWAWARTAGGFDEQTAATFSDIGDATWSVFANGGMYFDISDQNIPEPSSSGLLLAAVSGMWWIRFQRHA